MQLKNFDFKQKLMHHPEHLIALRAGARPFPTTLEIDLTNLCNHDCYFCVVKSLREEHRVSLNTKAVREAIYQLKNMGLKGISFTGGGEPMLHSGFYEILKEAHDLKLDTGLMTNGALIKENRIKDLLENLNWIRISVGAGSRELYRTIQGKDDYDVVIENIHALGCGKTASRKETNLGVRMLLDEENYHSLISLSKDLSDSGCDYLQVAPDCRDNAYSIFLKEDFRQVIEEAEAILKQSGISLLQAGFTQDQEERSYPKKCYAHYYQVALIATGDIVFCKNVRGHHDMAIGNINKNTIKEIWNSPENLSLEASLCPGNCSEICKNMQINVALEQFLNPVNNMSVNFIG